MSDFDWADAPEGERRKWGESLASGRECYYVITADGVTYFRWNPTSRSGWIRSREDPDHIRTQTVPVAPDLHPLVPGQQAIDWADELLRDPEVAGWTEARLFACTVRGEDNRGVVVIRRNSEIWSRGSRADHWTKGDRFEPLDAPYRSSAYTKEEQEETVTTEPLVGVREKLAQIQAEHEEFKARVYKVGRAAATEHGWCSVFEDLMEELGIEKPEIEWPKPGTLFRAPGVWGGDHVAVAIGDGLFRYVRYDDPDILHDATAARHPFLGDFTDPSQLEILPV